MVMSNYYLYHTSTLDLRISPKSKVPPNSLPFLPVLSCRFFSFRSGGTPCIDRSAINDPPIDRSSPGSRTGMLVRLGRFLPGRDPASGVSAGTHGEAKSLGRAMKGSEPGLVMETRKWEEGEGFGGQGWSE